MRFLLANVFLSSTLLIIQQTPLCDGLCQVLINQGQEELNILDIDALQLSQ